jgi:hypothetical protein
MKILFTSTLLILIANSFAQDTDTDLFKSWKSNTLTSLMESTHKKMSVTTYRTVKGEVKEESTSTYKKSKINPLKISFSTLYTEHYLLDNRKKSSGKYYFNNQKQITNFERTDLGQKNEVLGTFYHNYKYEHGVIKQDKNRFKKYIIIGAAEIDSLVTRDSLVYNISNKTDSIYQYDLNNPNTNIYSIVQNNQLILSHTKIGNYSENKKYHYNESGLLIMVLYILKSEAGGLSKNVLKLNYNQNQLLTSTEYYDDSNELIEKKLFTYK